MCKIDDLNLLHRALQNKANTTFSGYENQNTLRYLYPGSEKLKVVVLIQVSAKTALVFQIETLYQTQH